MYVVCISYMYHCPGKDIYIRSALHMRGEYCCLYAATLRKYYHTVYLFRFFRLVNCSTCLLSRGVTAHTASPHTRRQLYKFTSYNIYIMFCSIAPPPSTHPLTPPPPRLPPTLPSPGNPGLPSRAIVLRPREGGEPCPQIPYQFRLNAHEAGG